MPNMKALALTVWDKKIFKVFLICSHGNHSSSRNAILWCILKEHDLRIIYVKFEWNLIVSLGVVFCNCERRDGWMTDRSQYLTLSTSCSGELKIVILHVKIWILQETPFFHDSVNQKTHKLEKTWAHVATFNQQYNHEVSWNFDKIWMRY